MHLSVLSGKFTQKLVGVLCITTYFEQFTLKQESEKIAMFSIPVLNDFRLLQGIQMDQKAYLFNANIALVH